MSPKRILGAAIAALFLTLIAASPTMAAMSVSSGGYLEIFSQSAMDTSPATWSFRFKTSQATGSNIALMSRVDSLNSTNGMIVYLNTTGKVTVVSKNASANPIVIIGTTSTQDGNWHTVVLTFDRASGQAAALYLDGALEGSTTSVGTFTFNSQAVRHGKAQDGFWANFVGSLAEMAWWNVRLTTDEIGSLGQGFAPRRVRPASLVYYVPAIRDQTDMKAGGGTGSSLSVSDHPRRIG